MDKSPNIYLTKMRPKKKLYLAKNMEQLKTKCITSSASTKLEMLCRASETVHKKTLEVYEKNPLDEEFLYVISLRYLHLVNLIKKKVKDNNFINSRFSKLIADIDAIRVECEMSLIERYSTRDIPIDDFIMMSDEFVEPTPEVFIPPPPNVKEEDMFIDNHKLYKLMTDTDGSKLVIMDIRTKEDHIDTPIKFDKVVQVPEDAIRKGLTTNTVQRFLEGDSLMHYQNRHGFDVIVLIDLDTNKMSFKNSKIENFRLILTEWDFVQKNRSLPIVLEGGIRAFAEYYPTLVNNPTKIHNRFFGTLDDLMNDIEYPDILNPDQPPEEPVAAIEPRQIGVSIDNQEALPAEDQPLPTEAAIAEVDPLVMVEHIITVAEHQVDIENSLLEFTEHRFLQMKRFVSQLITPENCEYELENVGKNISKMESFRIQLDERRTLIDNAFNLLKRSDDNQQLNEKLEKIKATDRKRLSKYQSRKNVEMEETQMLKSYKENNKTAVPAYPIKVEVPKFDRKSKPVHEMSSRIIEHLQPTFRSSGISGLVNIKNTCYLNSLVQCLRFCPIILNHYIKKKPAIDTPLNLSFAEVIHRLWNEDRVALRPTNLYYEVCRADHSKKGYSKGCHEDVHEFFIYFIKSLHDEICIKITADPEQFTDKLKDWYKMSKGDTSFMHRAFYYQLELQHRCPKCGKCLVKYDYGNTVFVSCPENGNPLNLDAHIKSFTATTVDEMNQLKYCAKCEAAMILRKRISHYPAVLPINIVRYEFSKEELCILRRDNQCMFSKIIQFGSQQYTLKSMSLHAGNKDVGHYTALCLHPFQDKWIEFNDEQCSIVNANDPIYRSKCYMLFYTLVKDFDEVNRNFFPE